MTTILSDKGMIEIPEKFRDADGLKPGQRCDIERVSHGEYRVRVAENRRPLPLVPATGSPITQADIDDALDAD